MVTNTDIRPQIVRQVPLLDIVGTKSPLFLCIGTQSMEQLRYGYILSWRIYSKSEHALDFGSSRSIPVKISRRFFCKFLVLMDTRKITLFCYWNGCIKDSYDGPFYEGSVSRVIRVDSNIELSQLLDDLHRLTGFEKGKFQINLLGKYPSIVQPQMVKYVRLPIVDDCSLEIMLEVPSHHPSINNLELYMEYLHSLQQWCCVLVKRVKSLEKDDDSCTNCFKFAMTWSLLVSRGLRVMPTDGYGLYATDVAIQILQFIAEEFSFCSFKDTKLRKFTLELLERFGFVGWNHVSTILGLNLKLSPDIGDLKLDVSSYHLFDEVCSSLDATEYTSMANVVAAVQQSFHPVPLQRWSQDYDLIRQTIVAHFGWFGFILEFLYGSLPRPPDILSVFSPKFLVFSSPYPVAPRPQAHAVDVVTEISSTNESPYPYVPPQAINAVNLDNMTLGCQSQSLWIQKYLTKETGTPLYARW